MSVTSACTHQPIPANASALPDDLQRIVNLLEQRASPRLLSFETLMQTLECNKAHLNKLSPATIELIIANLSDLLLREGSSPRPRAIVTDLLNLLPANHLTEHKRQSTLHIAAEFGLDETFFQTLIDRGADLNLRDANGRLALGRVEYDTSFRFLDVVTQNQISLKKLSRDTIEAIMIHLEPFAYSKDEELPSRIQAIATRLLSRSLPH